MEEFFYFLYFILAIVTTYCAIVDDGKVVKILFAISAVCWWILFIGNIIVRIV